MKTCITAKRIILKFSVHFVLISTEKQETMVSKKEEIIPNNDWEEMEDDEEMMKMNFKDEWLFPRASYRLATVLAPGRVRPLSPTLKVYSPVNVFPGIAVLCERFDDMVEWKNTIQFVGFFAKMNKMFNSRHHWDMRTKFLEVRVRCMDKVVEDPSAINKEPVGKFFLCVPVAVRKALDEQREQMASDVQGVECVETEEISDETERGQNESESSDIELKSNLVNTAAYGIEGENKENKQSSDGNEMIKEEGLTSGEAKECERRSVKMEKSKSVAWFIPATSRAWFIPANDEKRRAHKKVRSELPRGEVTSERTARKVVCKGTARNVKNETGFKKVTMENLAKQIRELDAELQDYKRELVAQGKLEAEPREDIRPRQTAAVKQSKAASRDKPKKIPL